VVEAVPAAEEAGVVEEAGSMRGGTMKSHRLHLVKATVLAVLLVLCIPSAAMAAQERITSFDSVITVAQDGSMRVENTITALVTGDQIQHGIYYDFPTIYQNASTGGRMVIDFTVLGVQRDGQTEPYTVQNYSNGKRVKMGSADVTIPPGTHTWTLRFRVDRELGYFSDHDELYWNVTGNGWTLPIERASATVNLPAGAAATITGIAVYTGPVGSTASAATVSRGVDGTPTIVTSTVLNPGEGLTIAVGWPKGYIAQPSVLTRIGWFFRDNSALIAGLLGLIGVFVYYMAVWYRFGKDPERGTIIALFTPPEGMSPGGVRYLSRMAHDSKTFTAALIDMAVKRFVTIHEDGRRYWVERGTSDGTVLSDDEAAIAGTLLAHSSRVDFLQDNAEDIQSAIRANKRVLESDYQPGFFVSNSGYLLVGILCSIGVFMMTAFLSVSGTATQVAPVIIVALGLLAMGVVFSRSLKSYTARGRALMNRVEGFKLYLSVTEKDRMNLLNPPERTPEVFEKYLPYALALSVEQRWAEQFASVFAHMAAEGRPYVPVWYSGMYWNPANPVAFADNLGSRFTGAISAAAVAPGKSSGLGGGGFGGGGGASGGGGGGGGGGGW